MRASRLLSLMLLLQSRGRMSAAQLAAELGVTARTVYRDVDALAGAGVPIYAEHGPAGGYELMAGFRTRLTGLTAGEAESLLFTGMDGPAADLGFGGQVAAAQLKLLAALPVAYRDASLRIRERFHLDTPGWYREPDDVPHLHAAAGALWQDRAVEVDYRRWSPRPGLVTRRLHPLGLVLKAGVWYLVAAGTGPPRTYRVSSITGLRTLDDPVDRPAGFDLAAFWRDHVEAYEQAADVAVAQIRLTSAGLRRLPDVLGPKASRLALRTCTGPDADGWHDATIPLENVVHAAASLMQLGAEARAVGPPELVSYLRATIEAMAGLYRG